MSSQKSFAATILGTVILASSTMAGLPVADLGHVSSSSQSVEISLGVVALSGRVKTPEGRPIKGARIVIKDAQTNAVVRTALSSPFGYYRLDDIETGRSYVLSISHKTYLFALPSHLLEVSEERSNIDFVGEVID